MESARGLVANRTRSNGPDLDSGDGASLSIAAGRHGRRDAWCTAIATTLAFAAGLAIAHAVTDGFEAYTLESARRLQALRAPASVPDLALVLADDGRTRLSGMPGRVLLVDFVYTRCPTYCVALGSVYARLQRRLAPEIAAGEVRLVSVTFDPARDGPAELRAYRARHSADPAGWDLGRPARAGDVERWLAAFGVVVIPDGLGGYAHNAAVHVLGPDRKLVAILDTQDIDGIAKAARRAAGRQAVHVAAR
ncbi:MAG: SCO family protein [Betaproteobacteria bacterium]|nr:SCO family protein [Betaproteobacteria bacterium]